MVRQVWMLASTRATRLQPFLIAETDEPPPQIEGLGGQWAGFDCGFDPLLFGTWMTCYSSNLVILFVIWFAFDYLCFSKKDNLMPLVWCCCGHDDCFWVRLGSTIHFRPN